jgi:hypothetical protein
MVLPHPPTLEGYTEWVYEIMDVPQIVLPPGSIYLEMSFDIAFEMVNRLIWCASPGIFTIAVYNLGGDYLVNMAQDNPNLPSPDDTYWQDLRQAMNINGFLPGLINSAADQGTSAGVHLLAAMENLTITDLQNLKTPWGRVYLGIAQSVGAGPWGLTT